MQKFKNKTELIFDRCIFFYLGISSGCYSVELSLLILLAQLFEQVH